MIDVKSTKCLLLQSAVFFMLALWAISGCQTTTTTTTTATITTRSQDDLDEFEEKKLTDEEIENQIEIFIDALMLQTSRPDVICKKLIEFGKKSVPELGKNVDNKYTIIRGNCIYCLEHIYERTKDPAILALKPKLVSRFLYDPIIKVRLQAASALSVMGDYRGVPLLLRGLRNEDSYVRMMSAQSLRHLGKNAGIEMYLGYDHNSPPALREQQAQLWDQWWQENRSKYTAKKQAGQ